MDCLDEWCFGLQHGFWPFSALEIRHVSVLISMDYDGWTNYLGIRSEGWVGACILSLD